MTAGRSPRPWLLHDESLFGYDFGATHPMGPGRVRYALELAEQLGVLADFDVIAPAVTDPADLTALVRLVHDADYVDAVISEQESPERGLGTSDNPLVPGIHQVAALICAATAAAAAAVWTGQTDRAANIAGGLHHAMPSGASGFCIYNDLAVAIAHLQGLGAERIAYIDVDAHHGDGVQSIFYDDPSVLTISLHESPVHLFPGTGFPGETGGAGAEGRAVNVALPPDCSDAGWLRAFHAVVPPVVAEFDPQIIISQHGCDAHYTDPLTDLRLSIDGLRAAALAVEEVADRYANGRWVLTGGGGYSVVQAVPRAWTHALAVLAGRPLDPGTPVPRAWQERMGDGAPQTMTDGQSASYRPFETGFDPSSRLDQAILATRKAVFPEFGLDPLM